jgi:drug/metabolite transporter (DMT)-like permease
MTRLSPAQTHRGMIFLALGIFCFTAMDAIAKYLVDLYPTAQVIWARYIGHFACVALYLGRRFGPALKTAMPGWHLLRSATQLGATVFFFLSLNYMGLAEATALAGIAPLLITLGAALFLGEAFGPHRLIGVVLAMLGSLIVIRPGSGVFTLAAVLPMICAASYAANMLLTRLVGTRETPWAAMIYASVLGVIASSTVVPFYWQPIALGDLWAFAALGAIGAAAQLFIIRAYSIAEAGALAPFGYLDMVYATFWSIAIFNDWPDFYTIVGALVIALAGLYVWRQESRAAPARSPA